MRLRAELSNPEQKACWLIAAREYWRPSRVVRNATSPLFLALHRNLTFYRWHLAFLQQQDGKSGLGTGTRNELHAKTLAVQLHSDGAPKKVRARPGTLGRDRKAL